MLISPWDCLSFSFVTLILLHFSHLYPLNYSVILLTHHLWMKANPARFSVAGQVARKQTLRLESACRKPVRELWGSAPVRGKEGSVRPQRERVPVMQSRWGPWPTPRALKRCRIGVRRPGLSTLAWTSYGMWTTPGKGAWANGKQLPSDEMFPGGDVQCRAGEDNTPSYCPEGDLCCTRQHSPTTDGLGSSWIFLHIPRFDHTIISAGLNLCVCNSSREHL